MARRASFLLVLVGLLACAAPTGAQVVQRQGIRVGFGATMAPRHLPRHGEAPVRVSLAARIAGVAGSKPPLLRRIQIAINRHGRLERAGLPDCTMAQVQPTTDADAMRACGPALVGEGEFSAKVGFGGQAPFPASGRLLAFNGTYQGHAAILAHVYGTDPAPTSYTVPFLIEPGKGEFGTVLEADLPDAVGTSGYVTGISLSLNRHFTSHGEGRSYLEAGCPAPKGFPGATFTLARVRMSFLGGAVLSAAETSDCRVSG